MAGGAWVDQEGAIGGGAQGSPHDRQTADKLRDGKFELADQDASRSRDGKPGAARTGRQREGEVGDQQGFADLGLPTHEEDALRGQQSRFHQAGRRGRRLLLEKLRQRQHRGGWGLLGGGGHSNASLVASSKIDSSTAAALRAAARRKAVRASLLTLRRMPLV